MSLYPPGAQHIDSVGQRGNPLLASTLTVVAILAMVYLDSPLLYTPHTNDDGSTVLEHRNFLGLPTIVPITITLALATKALLV